MKSIEVKHLSYRYSADTELVLQDVSFNVAAGQWIAIVGHNGSGKSTLTKNLNGLLAPTSGEVVINGTTLTEDSVWDIRKQIGIVFQNPDNQFVGATVEDDVAFGLENRQIPHDEMHRRVKKALSDVGMADFATREPAHLSGGQKQRVALAGIIAMQPAIIILDEATSMLDPKGRSDVLGIVQALQTRLHVTVLSVTHDLEEAALADQILVLDGGRLQATGTPKEIFSQVDLIQRAGLTLPFVPQLTEDLKTSGITLPETYLSEEELISALWQLHSKM
ncbi:cobalt transporter atp-binding subunit [Agrilactobacillus composti DSM 18527 = JCM 14202]|uniref:Cobalt transporter atp-binding subunit n=1 Tax=Agrilactobacillus composti DSM 18527 = JCM 14202 TaxID=1423734 RepID=A0A0R1XSF8_9LACO|nr:energy-coupling factor ABC transporter ATP-binding protein [Agrilactobacillus composti]KRM32597.1 cobalt transporter atp-binding subunit [Agrilactobacillus composti DSM 18527 = JCM 14202]